MAVGGMGWKGVAVAVAFEGKKRKFGFMLTAAGAAMGPTGKLQADIKVSDASRMRKNLLRI
jgi:hypothetical protein